MYVCVHDQGFITPDWLFQTDSLRGVGRSQNTKTSFNEAGVRLKPGLCTLQSSALPKWTILPALKYTFFVCGGREHKVRVRRIERETERQRESEKDHSTKVPSVQFLQYRPSSHTWQSSTLCKRYFSSPTVCVPTPTPHVAKLLLGNWCLHATFPLFLFLSFWFW